MNFQYTPYIWLFLISAAIMATIGTYAWRNRTIPGAKSFAALMLTATVWSFGNLLELSGTDLPTKTFWMNVRYLGAVTAPLAWFALALEYTDRGQWLKMRNFAYLVLIPFIALVLLWTNHLHGLMRYNIHLVDIGSFSVIGKTHGPYFWILTVYLYILLLITFLMFVEALLRTPPAYRGQPLALMGGLLITFFGNGLHLLGFSPVPYTDPTAIFFIPTGILLAWGLFRYRLFNIMPVARDTIFENINDGVIVLDVQDRIIDLNIAARKIFNLVPTKVIGREAEEIFQAWSDLTECFRNPMATRKEFVLEKEGTKLSFDLNKSPLTDSHGRQIGRMIIVHNITERRRAEEALRENETKFRSLFDLSPQAVALVDLDTGRLVDVNDSFCKVSKYPKNEIVGRTVKETSFYTDKNRKKFLSKITASGEILGLDIDFKVKGGSILNTLLSAKVVHIADKAFIIIIIVNMTDQKRLHERLLQAQKMEAITALAGGLAHEFNNALASLVGSLELLQMDIGDNKNILKYIKTMNTSTRRMTNLTSQLLAYARGGKYYSGTISLNDLVKNTLQLIRGTINTSIRFETNFSKDNFCIEADITQMQMVLSTIVINAAEAIEKEGRIIISVNEKDIDANFAKQDHDFKSGSYVCLTIKDNGKGMEKETRDRIFEPFFSTKLQGRGLGMAAVFGIIKNHNGWISIDSELGEGTSVYIYLPAIEAKVEDIEEKTELTKGTGTILLIEDMKDVMAVGRAMVKRIGYTVLEAKTGNEAVDIVKNFKGSIDLAMLDIGLPDIEGERVFELIREIRPDIKVVVCSGYAIDGPVQNILNAGAQGFIQKPYKFNELSKKLKEVVEGAL
ncbi:MAG: PAS domain S-box protein [Desulfobacteraceae bacterium]|nr:PAS domain S-box protein [Desulfobacteraceae bacterium]